MKLRRGISNDEVFRILSTAVNLTKENHKFMNNCGSVFSLIPSVDLETGQIATYLCVNTIKKLIKELGINDKEDLSPLDNNGTFDSFYQKYVTDYLPRFDRDLESFLEDCQADCMLDGLSDFAVSILRITGFLNVIFFADVCSSNDETYVYEVYNWTKEQMRYFKKHDLEKIANYNNHLAPDYSSYMSFLSFGGKKLYNIMERNKQMPVKWQSITNKAYDILITAADNISGYDSGFGVMDEDKEINVITFRTDDSEYDYTCCYEAIGNCYLIGAIILATIDIVQKRYLKRSRREL